MNASFPRSHQLVRLSEGLRRCFPVTFSEKKRIHAMERYPLNRFYRGFISCQSKKNTHKSMCSRFSTSGSDPSAGFCFIPVTIVSFSCSYFLPSLLCASVHPNDPSFGETQRPKPWVTRGASPPIGARRGRCEASPEETLRRRPPILLSRLDGDPKDESGDR